jgi:iron complex outermembrane recepter protein
MKCHLRIITGLYFVFLTIFVQNAHSKSNFPPLPLELEDTEIVSVSKEKEPAFKAAASVYVLSSDDIRRSGATNIPEALRLVPGLEVSRAGSSKWSVTSRGFGRLYDNKVLVMIDGRELYSSVFTGTNWDISDVVLEDIDHIEIIRGTSTTLWGANTLNGVINVITKKAQYTQGGYVSATYGNQERSFEYRQGGSSGDKIFYRAYAKKLHREELKSVDRKRGSLNQGAGDDWGMAKTGFRVDWQKTLRDEITFLGDAHDGKEDQTLFIPTKETTPVHDSEHVSGFNLDARWKHSFNKTDNTNLHFYIDTTSRKSQLASIDRNIFNFDGEYHLQATDNNKLKLGVGYRYTIDEMKSGVVNNIIVNQFTPSEEKMQLYTAFLQDTYSIIPEKLDFIFGSKFEHHYITGSHFLPSAQLRWTPNKDNTIWTSASKGIREPSKLETNARSLASNIGPRKIYWQSNSDFKAEEITSYEIGYRNRSLSKLELDISAFFNEYQNVRSFEPNLTKFQYELYNRARARTQGINTSANVSVSNNWNVVFGYSYLDMDVLFNQNSVDTLSQFDAGASPHHQFQIQSRLNVTRNIDFDATFYYVSNLHKNFLIDSYKRTDLRVAWRPITNLELSIVGQKLFYGDTAETARPYYGTYNATYSNQVYGNVKWKF